ncbi:hypothetical protein PMAYCL1PPCAC_00202, partial [Pristionchus mayeri]
PAELPELLLLRIDRDVILRVRISPVVPQPDVEAGIREHKGCRILRQIGNPIGGIALESVLHEHHRLALVIRTRA